MANGCRGKETQSECESQFIRSDGACYRCVYRVDGNYRSGSKCGVGSKNPTKEFARRKCGTCPVTTSPPAPAPLNCAGLTEVFFDENDDGANGCRGKETQAECESQFIRSDGACFRCVYRVDGNYRSGSKCGIGSDNTAVAFRKTPCTCPR